MYAMSGYDSFVKKSLKECKYMNQDATKKEVLEVINTWRGLKPTCKEFVFGNGQKKKLLALEGTIPIQFKGSFYHIPVEIFLLETFPSNAPMVFVRPTSTMRIKTSRNVDTSGKVYLPFLHSWQKNSGLMSLIQVLIMTFGELPPVYSIPTAAQAMPPVSSPSSNVPYPVQQTAAYPTPYPSSSYSMPMPMPAMPMPPSLPQQQSSGTMTVTPAHIRVSLISAVSDKLKARLEDHYFLTQIEAKTGDQLKEGLAKLESMMKTLNEEKISVEKTITDCQNELCSLNEKIEKQTNHENEAIVDEAIQAPTPLYKQIVNTFAEEASVEDTIYYLSEALRSGMLDLDQFQKTLRILSRRQFMLRALLKKCRQKAGLAG